MIAIIEILITLFIISALIALTLFFWMWAWDLFKRLTKGKTEIDP